MGFACHCQDIEPRLCPALPLGVLYPTPAVHRRLSTGKLTSRGLPSLLTRRHSLCRLALNVPRIMSSDRPFAQREPALCYDTANGTLTQPIQPVCPPTMLPFVPSLHLPLSTMNSLTLLVYITHVLVQIARTTLARPAGLELTPGLRPIPLLPETTRLDRGTGFLSLRRFSTLLQLFWPDSGRGIPNS